MKMTGLSIPGASPCDLCVRLRSPVAQPQTYPQRSPSHVEFVGRRPIDSLFDTRSETGTSPKFRGFVRNETQKLENAGGVSKADQRKWFKAVLHMIGQLRLWMCWEKGSERESSDKKAQGDMSSLGNSYDRTSWETRRYGILART